MEKTLSSTFVSRELLQDLEALFDESAEEHSARWSKRSRDARTVVVTDEFGEESHKHVADMYGTMFPDTVAKITLTREVHSYEFRGDERDVGQFKVKITFTSKGSENNRVSISIAGPQAREKAIGLYERVRQIVQPHDIGSPLFPWWLVSVAGVGVMLGTVVTAISLLGFALRDAPLEPSALISFARLVLVLLGLGAYLYVGIQYHPTAAFDTRAWAGANASKQWLRATLTGAVLVSFGASYLLPKLLRLADVSLPVP